MIPDDLATLPRHEMSQRERSRLREFVLQNLLDDADPPLAPTPPTRLATTRGRLVSRRRWVVGLTTAAAAVTVLAGALITGRSTSPAWAAEPDQLTGAALQAARADCTDALRGVPGHGLPRATSTVVGDRRGSTSSVLLASPTSLGICIGTAKARLDGIVAVTPLRGATLTVDGQPGVMNGDTPTRVIVGRVNGATSKVTVSTDDGRLVIATVQSGYYLAWWPSGADAVSVTALARNGSRIGRLRPAAVNPGGRPPTPVRES